MSDSASCDPQSLFASGQIVALDHAYGTLYAETIQIVTQRQMCWVRTIAIAIQKDKIQDGVSSSLLGGSSPSQNFAQKQSLENASIVHPMADSDMVLIDLQRNIDLLLPLNLFRVAFDTEIIPILSNIELYDHSFMAQNQVSKQYLNWFLKEIWQSNQDKFQV